MKDLSIILVNTNNGPVIKPCIESVFAHTRDLDYEIIVADNGSTDGSLEYLRGLGDRIRLVENGGNLGFSKANNRGMAIATGKAVILLNSDTELTDNALKQLYDFLMADPNRGACGGTLIYPNGTPQWSFGHYPSFPRMWWTLLSGLLGIRAGRKEVAVVPAGISEPRSVEYIIGADLMMRKSVLDQVGLLDERFFIYFEETDLCRRITKAGYSIWFIPEVRITHHIEGSFKSRKPMRESIFYTSMFRYFLKHYGYYRPVRWFMMVKFWVHMQLGKAGSERREDAAFRYGILKETTAEYPFEF